MPSQETRPRPPLKCGMPQEQAEMNAFKSVDVVNFW